MLENLLFELGLDEKEVIIFLKINELGSTKASDIAREVELPKTTVIEKLYSLENRGLVSKTKDKNSFTFRPEDPEILLLELVRKEKAIEQLKKGVNQAVLELKSKRKQVKLPKVKYFEGKEGLKQLYEDTLNSETEIVAYGNFEAEIDYLGDYIWDYWEKRSKLGIELIGLIPDNRTNRQMAVETNRRHLRTTFAYDSKYATPLEIDVYDDKVIFVSFKEAFGVMVESEVIAGAMRNLLALARKSSEKV